MGLQKHWTPLSDWAYTHTFFLLTHSWLLITVRLWEHWWKQSFQEAGEFEESKIGWKPEPQLWCWQGEWPQTGPSSCDYFFVPSPASLRRWKHPVHLWTHSYYEILVCTGDWHFSQLSSKLIRPQSSWDILSLWPQWRSRAKNRTWLEPMRRSETCKRASGRDRFGICSLDLKAWACEAWSRNCHLAIMNLSQSEWSQQMHDEKQNRKVQTLCLSDIFWASRSNCEVKVKFAQSCPTLCNLMDYILYGILQARIFEWVAFLFSRGSSQPRDRTQVSHIAGEFFTSWATRILDKVTYPFSSGSSQPRNQTRIFYIAGRFFTNWDQTVLVVKKHPWIWANKSAYLSCFNLRFC